MTDDNFEAWKEIRARVDSIANALFLVAGGALSVSMAVLLRKDAPEISGPAKCLVSFSWYCLLYSVLAFLLIKGILVVQAYKLHGEAPNKEAWRLVTTYANWFLGISGIVVFVLGMILLVNAAVGALS